MNAQARASVLQKWSRLTRHRIAASYSTTGFVHVRRAILFGAAVAAVANFDWVAKKLTAVRDQGSNATAPPGLRSLVGRVVQGFASMDQLVDGLQQQGLLQDPRVAEAMRSIDRGSFVLPDMPRNYAYADSPLPIGFKQTISAPHMHATALDLLADHLRPGAAVLDVGSGSGYLTAAMGRLVEPDGQVFGVEKHAELAERSVPSIRAAAPDLLDRGLVRIMPGNVLGDVLKEYGPFDAIHVGAAADEIPQVLVDKLKPGGRMIIPVGQRNSYQDLYCVDKNQDGGLRTFQLMPVAYVPLTRPEE